MIDVHFWPTPNGHKVTIFLEEAGLAYKLIPVNILRGGQFDKEFLKIAPNNRIPAIVDTDNNVSVFESGAILLYLAEKTGKFLPKDTRAKAAVYQWLFWQMGGLGPMAGQAHHFRLYATEKVPYGIDRYTNEVHRLYRVLNDNLASHEYVAGDYSIADMAIYPWIVPHERQGQDLNEFPALKAWFHKIAERPAVKRAYEKGNPVSDGKHIDEESKKFLFSQR